MYRLPPPSRSGQRRGLHRKSDERRAISMGSGNGEGQPAYPTLAYERPEAHHWARRSAFADRA